MRAFLKIIALVLCIAVIFPVCAGALEESLILITPPDRVDFYEGRDWVYVNKQITPLANFDMTGTVVEYDGMEIPFYIFPWGANMWSEPVSGKWQTGLNDVYILIDDVDGVYTRSSVNLHSIRSIAVIQAPNYTNYIRGIDWDYNSDGGIDVNTVKLDGLNIKVFYSDGTNEIIAYNRKTQNITWTITDDTFKFSLGTNRVYASYCGKTAAFTFDIELESVVSASTGTQPSKRTYYFGDDWKYVNGRITPDIDLSGLVANVTYNNGRSGTISYDEEPERFAVKQNQEYWTNQSRLAVMLDSAFELSVSFGFAVCGDVNLDGIVNSTDALCVLKYIVGNMELDEIQIRYSDVNDDGRINSADALSILNKSVGLITFFEAEI